MTSRTSSLVLVLRLADHRLYRAHGGHDAGVMHSVESYSNIFRTLSQMERKTGDMR